MNRSSSLFVALCCWLCSLAVGWNDPFLSSKAFIRSHIQPLHGWNSDSESRWLFLRERNDQNYLNTIKQLAVLATRQAILQDQGQLLEISFPESLVKNDISSLQSNEVNYEFTREFMQQLLPLLKLTNNPEQVLLLFPDKKECNRMKLLWGNPSNSFTMSAISNLANTNLSPETKQQIQQLKLVVAINPGFNVEEWINLANLRMLCDADTSVVVINGNLDRLRKGYYPSLFYPALNKVTNEYYRRFSSALSLVPVSISGDRLGAWLVKFYQEPWQLIVKDGRGNYQVMQQFEQEPEPKLLWNNAKSLYAEARGQKNTWF